MGKFRVKVKELPGYCLFDINVNWWEHGTIITDSEDNTYIVQDFWYYRLGRWLFPDKQIFWPKLEYIEKEQLNIKIW